jgi:hypothetical protein
MDQVTFRVVPAAALFLACGWLSFGFAPRLAQAPSLTASDFPDLQRIAASPGWPGYFGAPRYASAELGRRLVEAENHQFVTLALGILDGLDEREIPRLSVIRGQSPGPASVWRASAVHDSTVEARQRAWLVRHGRR